ncbi:hypothetical protein FIBSPDRAFT_41305 [Athelia psychrophila]|uniref:F-box domain-containing protein n=1 Tax=Athelia psychrophila TaxID=1759441 RepID=A0A166FM25_9AGAM|nr:hypothetical protein FIBSPDRAFT_41305 [Fibularhizoctonia sp. CBS 109695]
MDDSARCSGSARSGQTDIAGLPPPFLSTNYTPTSIEEAVWISPIRRLPSDMLVEIFDHLLPIDNGEDPTTSDVRRDRMLPSHICKRWRGLSLSTPTYWADIYVRVDREDCSCQLKCAKNWLARSGNCPLTIVLLCSGDYRGPWSQLVALFLPHCRRWRDASLVTPIRTDWSPIRHNLPMLESLMVVFAEWPDDMPFEFAPKLRRLSWSTFGLITYDSLLTFPLTQLTHVDIMSGSSVPDCLAIMQKLSSIIVLKIALSNSIAGPAGGPLLRIDHLEDFTVSAEQDTTGFHECLNLPSLVRYKYSEGESDARWSLPSFMSLISHSSCRLAFIDVSLAVAIRKDDMDLLLHLLPHLAHLNLHCNPISGINSNNIAILMTRSATSFLVPQLEHLVLDYDKDFECQLFFDMMESRHGIDEKIPGAVAQSKHLRAVEICHFGSDRLLDHGVMGHLDALEAGGLNIKLLREGTQVRETWYAS